MHPKTVVYLEHDGKLLLVDENGNGPRDCVMGRTTSEVLLRFPTPEEVDRHGISWTPGRETDFRFGNETFTVLHGEPNIDWPEHWAWKDKVASDNAVHPVARDAVYRSIHRLVSKVMNVIVRKRFSWRKLKEVFSRDTGAYLEVT